MYFKDFIAAISLAMALCAPLQAMAERVALVIGMGQYKNVQPLQNTINDAEAIARSLEQVGFTVTLANDKSQAELLDILQSFSFQAETADLALVYYAGHGVEVGGVNYLVPVDAKVKVATDIERVGVSLNQVLKAAGSARKMRVVILDSCRNNPFVGIKGFEQTQDTSTSGNTADPNGAPQGLAPVNPELGTLVAYAARAGQVALDGAGEHSPYATALMKAFGEKNVEIGLMFRQVRDEVLAQTQNLQEPYQYGSLSGEPFFLGDASRDGMLSDPEAMKVAWSATPPNQQIQMEAEAASGDTRSMMGLAQLLQNPLDERYDIKEALKYWKSASDAGEAQAEYEMAKIYENGLYGEAQDYAKSLELYTDAANKGFAGAINDLGLIYFQGGFLGLQADRAKGLDLFRQAADLRHPEAMFNYAGLIDDGLVEGKTPEDAAGYLYQSLRSGSEQVLNQLRTAPNSFKVATRQGVQRLLKANNFYKGPIDGDFGKSTQAAINAAFGL